MQVSGSTPFNVRDFFRLPPTTTEAIILTGRQVAIACSRSVVLGGGAVGRWLSDERTGGISSLSQPKIRPFPWALQEAAGEDRDDETKFSY